MPLNVTSQQAAASKNEIENEKSIFFGFFFASKLQRSAVVAFLQFRSIFGSKKILIRCHFENKITRNRTNYYPVLSPFLGFYSYFFEPFLHERETFFEQKSKNDIFIYSLDR